MGGGSILVERRGAAPWRALACALFAAALVVAAPGGVYAQVAASAAQALLEHARALSAAGKAEEAYRALAEHEDEYIGEIEFDYAIGRAALDSGRPDRATLAFTRVLAADPAHAGASIDMGRAYLALGNGEQARAVFEGLLALNPPAALRERLTAYLAQASGAVERSTFISGFVAASAGRDSNVNAATAQARIFVPLFGAEVDLAGRNVGRADNYAGLSAGIDIAHQFDRRYALIGGVDAIQRRNARESQFDIDAVAARIGVARTWDRILARAQMLSARSYVDRQANRVVSALALDVSEVPGAATQWSGFAQAGRYRHLPAEQRVFDADFVSAGAGVRRTLESGTALTGNLSAGREYDFGGNPGGDRRLWSALIGVEQPLAAGFSVQASAGLQDTAYQREDPAFLATRHDRRADLELALQYQFNSDLRLRLGARRTRQASNVPIYAYSRQDVGITLRRDFH
jgi:tetratricopeptide (TPR) repeat protein